MAALLIILIVITVIASRQWSVARGKPCRLGRASSDATDARRPFAG
jgi:hypothetical protein